MHIQLEEQKTNAIFLVYIMLVYIVSGFGCWDKI